MIQLPDDPTWGVALELAERLPEGWTLIGARLVELHAYENDTLPPRRSLDLDVLAATRLLPESVWLVSRALIDAGFEFAGANAANIGHRFTRGDARVDVLAPDGVGRPSRLQTIAGARTVEVPGGTQALNRSEKIPVRFGDREGTLPRANLLGAILIKSRAVRVHDAREAQLRDLAFLLTLVSDPFETKEGLRKSERRWLLRCTELLEADHPAWRGLNGAEDGRLALGLLTGVSD